MSKKNVTIITGFLGAGKTTLLNNILEQGGDEKIAVVINEYGEVGIDGQLVVETADTIVELNNGCICCTVRGDLVAAIGELVSSGRPIDRLIVETSGLADPAPVIQSFVLDDVLKSHVRLDAIVTVVDARHFRGQVAKDEAREQVAFADVLLINKTDLEDAASLDATEREIRRLNPLAAIHRIRDGAASRAAVLDIGAFDLKNLLAIEPDLLGDHAHEHADDIACVALTIAEPLSPDLFNRWFARFQQARGRDLLRMKGVLSFEGENRRYVFHGVHMTADGRPGRPWGAGEIRVSQIVFIGRHLDAAEIGDGVAACRSLPAQAA
ncbi:CobW family GTP-binding protein [Hansschlegelia zhihuaiae]|uniref:GTP-binding protein n=1 Tax=Hansschlegelia zhihuaiae TaxID=405005 RepID=A0A4V1KJC6_9HYPH|nr:GTP-binding protein [Hansschlegelia zhihuaiae]RXF73722.1 GTP-binding protein [Hansschlegelia zhihuaiae]